MASLGTTYSMPRLYSFPIWSTRVFVRDSLKVRVGSWQHRSIEGCWDITQREKGPHMVKSDFCSQSMWNFLWNHHELHIFRRFTGRGAFFVSDWSSFHSQGLGLSGGLPGFGGSNWCESGPWRAGSPVARAKLSGTFGWLNWQYRKLPGLSRWIFFLVFQMQSFGHLDISWHFHIYSLSSMGIFWRSTSFSQSPQPRQQARSRRRYGLESYNCRLARSSNEAVAGWEKHRWIL